MRRHDSNSRFFGVKNDLGMFPGNPSVERVIPTTTLVVNGSGMYTIQAMPPYDNLGDTQSMINQQIDEQDHSPNEVMELLKRFKMEFLYPILEGTLKSILNSSHS